MIGNSLVKTFIQEDKEEFNKTVSEKTIDADITLIPVDCDIILGIGDGWVLP